MNALFTHIYLFALAFELKRAVRKNMHWLVQNLEPMDHLDFLFSLDALNREEYEIVRKQLTATEKVRINFFQFGYQYNFLYVEFICFKI